MVLGVVLGVAEEANVVLSEADADVVLDAVVEVAARQALPSIWPTKAHSPPWAIERF